jgi:predicted nucleic acid-binding protein
LRLVISDATPLRYLVLIGAAELLPALYGEVLVPESVASELGHPHTPEAVWNWMARPPAWLQIVSLKALPPMTLAADLDRGEYDAIRLALDRNADLVLMDDREGVEEARRLGLTVTGTLGILDRAAERNLIDLAQTFNRLRQTNFRVDPALLVRLLEADAKHRA